MVCQKCTVQIQEHFHKIHRDLSQRFQHCKNQVVLQHLMNVYLF